MQFANTPTGTEHPPAFVTASACQDWLAAMPVSNPSQAQVALLRQLNLLQQFTLEPDVRLEILELMRAAVRDVQDDIGKKFAGRPLPMTPPEQAAYDGTIALWSSLLAGYLRLIAVVEGNATGLRTERARILQRALAVLADLQLEYCRGQQMPDSGYWSTLHGIFSVGERLGLLTEEVNDPVRQSGTPTSALATYAESLLLSTASPFELPPRHLGWVAGWARRWGSKLSVDNGTNTDPTQAAPIYVALGSGNGPVYQSVGGAHMRRFATDILRNSIKARILLLDQGDSPARLNLGEDCTQPAVGHLLRRVYQRWCKGGAVRRHERKAASGVCDFIAGYMAVHYYISGRQAFVPPVRDDAMLRKERDELATFGEHSKRKIEHYSTLNGYEIEAWDLADDWQMVDQSSSGLRLKRPLRAGVRIGHGQLVAVKMTGSTHYVIGGLRWVLHENPKTEGASLCAGIELFPGIATPMAVRPTDVREPFLPGFYLPAVAALSEPESVILPAGSFRINRPFEFVIERQETKMVVDHVIERTSEFERCSFRRV